MTYYPNTFKPEKSIYDFVGAVRESLIYWYMIHTDAETWAEQWTVGEDATWAYKETKGNISNNYFSFDWKESALKQWAKDNMGYFLKCPECGIILEDCYCEECEDENGDALEMETLEESDFDYFMDYTIDCEIEPTEEQLIKALVNDGFMIYRQCWVDYIASIEDEILECLQKIDSSENNQDFFFSIMWAMKILHLNGNITEDYGDMIGLDYKMVCSIREDGIKEYFTSEEVEEFFEDAVMEFSPLPFSVREVTE